MAKKYILIGYLIPLLIVVLLWDDFYFLCDDAFIAFRYVRNSVLGFGYVWNPPPFRPVEGYTSFLWLVLLEGIWRAAGIEPPASAPFLSLCFSLMTITLTIRISQLIMRSKPTGALNSFEVHVRSFLAGTMLALSTTFLTWTSSGLETAMFNFLTLLWLRLAFVEGWSGRLPLNCLVASLIALTRPEGYLFCAISLLLALFEAKISRFNWQSLLGIGVLVVPTGAHLLWRHSHYGFWLPNTYYAKVVQPWPEAGWRYLFLFVLESSSWLAFPIFGIFLFEKIRSIRLRPLEYRSICHTGLVLSPFLFAGLYHTFIVGGDHFEFRIYSLLLPLFFIGFSLAVGAVGSPGVRLAVTIGFCLLQLPLQWAHHINDQKKVIAWDNWNPALAPSLPSLFRPFTVRLDELEEWLFAHSICVRRAGHRAFFEWYAGHFKGSVVSELSAPQYRWRTITAEHGVGAPGWYLPYTFIVDKHGLNDPIISRWPIILLNSSRRMAHDRQPPSGYVECFQPNYNVFTPELPNPTSLDQSMLFDRIERCQTEYNRRLERETASSNQYVTLDQITGIPNDGTPWDSLLAIVINRTITIGMIRTRYCSRLEMSLDNNDSFIVNFRKFGLVVASSRIETKVTLQGGLTRRQVVVPEPAVERGYDEIQLIQENDDLTSIGGLNLTC